MAGERNERTEFLRLFSVELRVIDHLWGDLRKLGCWSHPGASGCFTAIRMLRYCLCHLMPSSLCFGVGCDEMCKTLPKLGKGHLTTAWHYGSGLLVTQVSLTTLVSSLNPTHHTTGILSHPLCSLSHMHKCILNEKATTVKRKVHHSQEGVTAKG